MASSWDVPWSLDFGLYTHVGRVRRHNEDAAKASPDLHLFSVADGMGGHQAGERASNIAVEALHEYLRQARAKGLEPEGELLGRAFRTANSLILEDARGQPGREGMGTTLTAILLAGRGYRIGHVGDSRIWRIRGDEAEQLTEDHSLVAAQVRDGSLSPEEAESHPMRHVLSRSLGIQEELEVDVLEGKVEPGDAFVLASDGLVRALDGPAIAAILAAAPDAAAASRELVERACELDGGDNVTAVVVSCRAG